MSKRRDAMKDMLAPITGGPEDVPRNVKPSIQSGALRSMNQAFETLTQDAEAAAVLRAQIASGSAIIEIDANDIAPSFVKDRIDSFDTDDFADLQESLATHGQILPVLVRHHPEKPGLYQLAFGHRRVEALRRLGFKVKAVVRELDDENLIVAQGKENLDRKDLSFIERALFALRLEERGVRRDVILAALGAHKGNLSTMISLTRQIPEALIVAIGAAPKIGRPRWEQLAAVLAHNDRFDWGALVGGQAFKSLTSDERFERILSDATIKTPALSKAAPIASREGVKFAQVEVKAKKTRLTIDDKIAPAFADYLVEHLPEIFENFRSQQRQAAE